MGRGLELKTADRVAKRDHVTRVQCLARERADAQARRIPWQRLLHARDQYIDWQEFQLWVRSILEVENGIPNWLVEILNTSCPGFLESEKRPMPKRTKNRPLPLRLEDWIEDHIFGFVKQEGWFNAVTYYAVRDPRYQRAEVCWSECVEKWKNAKPLGYPSFDEWKAMAVKSDDTARLTARERKARASAKLVDPDRLDDAAARYMEYEAFGYWARHALECQSDLPAEVARALEYRCPGYLEAERKPQTRQSRGDAQDWQRLMLWVRDHFFQDARNEGWFDAILVQVRSHPRAIRTMEYANHCEEVWGPKQPNPYPSFEDWRSDADSYVDSDD
jgi:hypothetical protein